MMETALGLESVADWIRTGGTVGLLAIATKFFIDNKRLRLTAKKDDRDGYGDLIDRLNARVAKLESRSEEFERDLDDCRRQHAEERAKRMELEALLLGRGEGKQEAARIVAVDRLEARKEQQQ